MKYCLSGRQPASILKQVDEIKVQHKDYRIISDYLVDYPNAKVIWELPNEIDDFKNIILQYNEMGDKYRFICCLRTLADVDWFKLNKVPFYYGFPVNSYYDLKALDDLGVEYVRIAPPLTHDMATVCHFGCEIRAVPNVAYDAYIPRVDGIIGGWIRPEDIAVYEEGIDVFEFEGNLNLEQERTLWEIYKKGKWPGNLEILITNLNIPVPNPGLPDEFGSQRANCRQRCMQNGTCHYCSTAFHLATALKKHVEEERRKDNG